MHQITVSCFSCTGVQVYCTLCNSSYYPCNVHIAQIKSQSPPAAVLYMCHVLHKMKSQSPAVQLQRPPVQSPAAAVLYRCNVFLLLLLLCIVQMKSQSPGETVQVYRCKAPPATLAQTKSQSLAAAAAHCTLYRCKATPASPALCCTK